jgi:diaminopimelate decarboxylase
LEAASIGEMMQAIAAEAPCQSIVFDCPVKPRKELVNAIDRKIALNADKYSFYFVSFQVSDVIYHPKTVFKS